jgi:hypothetical protein
MLRISRWSDGEMVGYWSQYRRHHPWEAQVFICEGLAEIARVVRRLATERRRQNTARIVYLVESPFAVMKFHQLGFPPVSTFGWTVSPAQADIIGQMTKGIVFLPDASKTKRGNAICACWRNVCG